MPVRPLSRALVAFSATSGLALVCPLAAHAQSATYDVVVTTASSSGAGTDNYVTMTVSGSKGSFSHRLSTMSNEAGQVERVTVTQTDVGTITGLRLALSNQVPFGDDWRVLRVQIDRRAGPGELSGGSASFELNLEVDSGSSISMKPSRSAGPRMGAVDTSVQVYPEGTPQVSVEAKTVCQMVDNTTGAAPVTSSMRTHVASHMPSVQASRNGGPWQSLDAAMGSIPAARRGSWNNGLATPRSNGRTHVETRAAQTIAFVAPPQTAVFRCAEYKATYSAQTYNDGASRMSVRAVSQPVAVNVYEVQVPTYDPAGLPIPAVTGDLQTKVLPYLRSQDQVKVRDYYLAEWRTKGWVADQAKGPETTLTTSIELRRGAATMRKQIELASVRPTSQDLMLVLEDRYYDRSVVDLLLEKGVKPDGAALDVAIRKRDGSLLDAMLQGGATANAAHVRTALQARQNDMVYVMLRRGVTGLTANDLALATRARDVRMAGALVRAGAPSTPALVREAHAARNAPMLDVLVPATPPNEAALQVAAEVNDPGLFQAFVTRGARMSSNKPVETAIDKGNDDVLALGLGAGGNADQALAYAMQRKRRSAMEVCLRGKANPDPVLGFAMAERDPALFARMLTTYRANASKALAMSVKANNQPFATIAIREGRANPAEPLPALAKRGNLAWVQFLVGQGADPTAGAMAAIEGKQAPTLSLLVDKGAKVSAAPYVSKAASVGSLPMVKTLVERGGAKADDARVAAIAANDLAMVSYLLDKGAAPRGLDVPAANGQLPMVQLLVKRGADPNEGVQHAVTRDRAPVALFLIDAGASLGGLMPVAAKNGSEAIVTKLLDKGVKAQDGIGPAVQHDRLPVARILIDAGADVSGHQLLDAAVGTNGVGMVKLLVKHGADLQHVDGMGDTYLHRSARKPGAQALVSTFIELGLDVNAGNEAGDTALHIAAREERVNEGMVIVLIDADADVNANNKDGRTPLREANGRGNKKLLRDAGAKRK